MYVLDSSVFIELIKDSPVCKKIVNIIGEVPAVITVFTINEVLVGAKGIEKKAIEKITEGVNILNFDKDAAIKSADIEQFLTKQGRKINNVDTFIAGICISQQKTIVTLDKHFKRIPGLKCVIV